MEGIINVNKTKGMTSYDVIRSLKRILWTKRIGHTGTLDPLAEGVLVVCVGKATKMASVVEAKEKIYVTEMELGYSTSSYDTETEIINKSDLSTFNINESKLNEVFKNYIGEQEQIPPMHSAIKVNGQKLYELARQNIIIERKPRKVFIDYINFLDKKENKVTFETKVSKGTYIRSLVNDIGEELGTYACMTGLKRTAVGKYTIENSFTIEEIEKMMESENKSFIKSVEESFEFDKLELLNDKNHKLFINGNTVVRRELKDSKYRVYYNDSFMGLANCTNGALKGYKYFNV